MTLKPVRLDEFVEYKPGKVHTRLVILRQDDFLGKATEVILKQEGHVQVDYVEVNYLSHSSKEYVKVINI